MGHCIQTDLIYSLILPQCRRLCWITPLLLCSRHSLTYIDLGSCFRKKVSLPILRTGAYPLKGRVRCVQYRAGSTRYRQINTNAPNELAAPVLPPPDYTAHVCANGIPGHYFARHLLIHFQAIRDLAKRFVCFDKCSSALWFILGTVTVFYEINSFI